MKTDNISMIKVNGYDCFYLKFLRSSTIPLDFYLDQFNIEDYWIYKITRHQKKVSIEEFMDFKYAGYIFFKKDKYKMNGVESWVSFFLNRGNTIIQYLTKPLPPFDPKKIVIKK